jgi:hypothetical protein
VVDALVGMLGRSIGRNDEDAEEDGLGNELDVYGRIEWSSS